MTRSRKSQSLNPPQFVRRVVFGMSQAAWAKALGLRSQGTVSKWESAGEFTSVKAMKKVRALAKKRKVMMSDTWLFEVPRHVRDQAEETTKKT